MKRNGRHVHVNTRTFNKFDANSANSYLPGVGHFLSRNHLWWDSAADCPTPIPRVVPSIFSIHALKRSRDACSRHVADEWSLVGFSFRAQQPLYWRPHAKLKTKKKKNRMKKAIVMEVNEKEKEGGGRFSA